MQDLLVTLFSQKTNTFPKAVPNSAITGKSSLPASKMDSFVKKFSGEEKLSEKEKASIIRGAIVGAAIGTGLAALIIYKAKIFKTAKFKKHIDFVKANTMEEAKAFSRKHFGIKQIELGNDVEMLNWVNEGLVNINNRFKGRASMPKKIAWDDSYCKKKAKKKVEAYCYGEELFFNKKKFSVETCQKRIKNFIKRYRYFDTVNENEIERLRKKGLGAHSLEVLTKLAEYYKKFKKNTTQATRFDANFIDNLVVDLNVADARFLAKRKKFKQARNLLKYYEVDNFVFKDAEATYQANSIFDTVYHEMGHLIHFKNLSMRDTERFLSKNASKEFRQNLEKQKIASWVSIYSQSSPEEFVAECFSVICSGRKLPKEVMDMYKYYKGPIPPGM